MDDTPTELSVVDGYALWSLTYDREPNALIAVEDRAVGELIMGETADRVLDLGCGTGRHALRLATSGSAVTAVDVSLPMMGIGDGLARRNHLPIDFAVVDIGRDLPFRSHSFDLVICGLALCHVPDIDAVARECSRVLRPGGRLLVTDFHPDCVKAGLRTEFRLEGRKYWLPNADHTREHYLEAVTRAGFTVQRVIDVPVRDIPAGIDPQWLIDRYGDLNFCLAFVAQSSALPFQVALLCFDGAGRQDGTANLD